MTKPERSPLGKVSVLLIFSWKKWAIFIIHFPRKCQRKTNHLPAGLALAVTGFRLIAGVRGTACSSREFIRGSGVQPAVVGSL